jgi:hypothetical protein
MITIAELEARTKLPAPEWAGKCYEVACVAAELVDGAVPVYGHYLGLVVQGTLFEDVACGFVQHGWVQLPDGRVLDPTRWVFEGAVPYIWVGSDDEYDEGGNRFREALLGPPPPFDADGEVFEVTANELPAAGWQVIEKLLDLDAQYLEGLEPGWLCREQLFWLANVDPRRMRGQARAIYAMLEQFELRGFIPIDNLRMVERSPL